MSDYDPEIAALYRQLSRVQTAGFDIRMEAYYQSLSGHPGEAAHKQAIKAAINAELRGDKLPDPMAARLARLATVPAV